MLRSHIPLLDLSCIAEIEQMGRQADDVFRMGEMTVFLAY